MPKISNKEEYPNVSEVNISPDNFLIGTVAATGETRTFPTESISIAQIDRVEVINSTITSTLFVGLDNTTLKKYCAAHADGSELLSREKTTVQDSSTGIVALDTTAYDGKTVYVKRFKNS